MPEDPEEVHPEYGGAAGLRIEEVPAEIAIDQQHDLRRGKRRHRDQKTIPAITRLSQTSSGMRPSVIPGHRMQGSWR